MLRSLEANFAMSTEKELPTFRKIEIPSSSSISHPGRVFLPLLGCLNLKMNEKLSFKASLTICQITDCNSKSL